MPWPVRGLSTHFTNSTNKLGLREREQGSVCVCVCERERERERERVRERETLRLSSVKATVPGRELYSFPPVQR